jgi:hypothetical protein
MSEIVKVLCLPTPMSTEATNAGISVLQIGNRLEITANVDAAGLKKLREVLSCYEQILKLMQ